MPIRRFALLLIALLSPAAARPQGIDASREKPPETTERPRPRSFLTAAAEVVAVELIPWAIDRYIAHDDFAYISAGTVRENFRTGFHFDRDDFHTNQFQHPYHGGLFFNAARSNGYGFWESGAFVLAGSLVWECCMENTSPSVNDLVNTTLGGMALGEITHRLAAMVRDNQATGSRRFWLELGSMAVDPWGGFDRLVHGEWRRVSPNPEERYPRGFDFAGSLGYRHLAGGSGSVDRGILSLSAAYGDPFEGEIEKPFDSFWVDADLSSPAEFVTRVEGRGILKGWELGERSDRFRHVFGFFQEYDYFHNESQVFGAQSLGAELLSRFESGSVVATTDVGAFAFPLAGIQTADRESPDSGRTYDYAPGGGLRFAARVDQRRGWGAAFAYGIAWAHGAEISNQSTLQFLRASARLSVYRSLGLGAGYAWYSRRTSYPDAPEERRTQSEWRVFASWKFDRTRSDPKTLLPQ